MTAMSVPTVPPRARTGPTLGEIRPTREEFRELAVRPAGHPGDPPAAGRRDHPVGLYATLAGDRPGTFLLESAENGRSWSRWSFVGVSAPAVLTEQGGTRLGWAAAGRHAARRRPAARRWPRHCACCTPSRCRAAAADRRHGRLPRLRRGPALERIDTAAGSDRPPAVADPAIPELVMLLATDLAALDHHGGTVTLIANAVNWDGTDERVDETYDDAVRATDEMSRRAGAAAVVAGRDVRRPRRRGAPADGVRRLPGHVESAKEHIRAGDAFQIVLSQRFDVPTAPTRWTSTGCSGRPTRARTCTCCGCPPRTASRSPWSARPRRRW